MIVHSVFCFPLLGQDLRWTCLDEFGHEFGDEFRGRV